MGQESLVLGCGLQEADMTEPKTCGCEIAENAIGATYSKALGVDGVQRHSAICLVLQLDQALQAARAEIETLKAANQGLLTAASDWWDDLESISDEPVFGDPMRTVRLVKESIERLLTKRGGSKQ